MLKMMTPEQHAQRVRQLELKLEIADYGLGMPRDYERVLSLKAQLADAKAAAYLQDAEDRYEAHRS
jgi:hypothetical protein